MFFFKCNGFFRSSVACHKKEFDAVFECLNTGTKAGRVSIAPNLDFEIFVSLQKRSLP